MFRRTNSPRSAEDERLLAEGSFVSFDDAVASVESETNRAFFAYYDAGGDVPGPSGTLFILLRYDGAQGPFSVLETVSNLPSASQSERDVIYLDRIARDAETIVRDFASDPRRLSYFPCSKQLAITATHLPLGRALDMLGWSTHLAQRAPQKEFHPRNESGGEATGDAALPTPSSASLRKFWLRLFQILTFIAAFLAARHLWRKARPVDQSSKSDSRKP